MTKAFIKYRFTLDPKLAQFLTREDFNEITERFDRVADFAERRIKKRQREREG